MEEQTGLTNLDSSNLFTFCNRFYLGSLNLLTFATGLTNLDSSNVLQQALVRFIKLTSFV